MFSIFPNSPVFIQVEINFSQWQLMFLPHLKNNLSKWDHFGQRIVRFRFLGDKEGISFEPIKLTGLLLSKQISDFCALM